MQKITTIIIIIILAGVGIYFFTKSPSTTDVAGTPLENGQPSTDVAKDKGQSVIGTSVESREITAYHYGEGNTELLFVGGVHGGYSWNTVLLVYEMMDYLKENPSVIPKNVKVTVIPVLNPDGLFKVVGTPGRFTQADVSSSQEKTVAGRFNAHNVDLNRNFDCDWQATSMWQNKIVSSGSKAFSEPESQALKNYVATHKPSAVVAWYSAAGGVFPSNCGNGISSETRTITTTYAKASGYPAYESFDFYEITGDMMNWFARNNVPAISVLLTNHASTEWAKNKAGVEALLTYYAE